MSKHLQNRINPLPHPSHVPPLHFNFPPYLHINVPHLAHINEIVFPRYPPFFHLTRILLILSSICHSRHTTKPHVPTYTTPSSGSSARAASTQARKKQHLTPPTPAHVSPAFVNEKLVLRNAGHDLGAPTNGIGAVAGYVKERYLQLTITW